MCKSGRANLEAVGKELDCVYAELRETKKELAEEKKAREAAELETYRANQRNMCLTRKADVSNFCMMTSYVVLFVALGLMVYTL